MRTLAALERGSISERPQTAEGATYARKIAKGETRIDWTSPAGTIDCLVRGLSPQPGAWCEVRGERLKVLYAVPTEGSGAAGEVLDDRFTIACGDRALRVTRVRRAGRESQKAEEFLRGFPLRKGDLL